MRSIVALVVCAGLTSAVLADVVIKRFNDFGLDARAAALTLLSSRTIWSRALLAAVDAGKIDASLIPLDTVRLMTLHPDADLAAAIGRHWPDLRGASSADMQSMLGRVHDILAVGRGDPYKGKVLYRASCGKCHLLYGDGGRIGPDLTSYQRKDQQRILLNVINPSAEIREGFEAYNVLTSDGRVLSGFLFDRHPSWPYVVCGVLALITGLFAWNKLVGARTPSPVQPSAA